MLTKNQYNNNVERTKNFNGIGFIKRLQFVAEKYPQSFMTHKFQWQFIAGGGANTVTPASLNLCAAAALVPTK